MTGFGDPPRQPKYMIHWIEYGNNYPSPVFKGTLIYLPTGVEGEDEVEVGSETSIFRSNVAKKLEAYRDNHRAIQPTKEYREEFGS